MTIALDSTALVARHVIGPGHDLIVAAMEADRDWCASALALTEAVVLAERLFGPELGMPLRGALLEDWSHFAVVPVDQSCLERAAELARAHPLRTIDALHLAAADRLPRPVRYATLDAHQIPVAESLGFSVISPTS
ncbi:MAG: type II toxin-antitoxin system VapC family toxin [Actinobacteria bacterium]|nr:type II toxin-antitoxin system VapC family toxin [Actinomycetota bacterium]